jgi:NAD(P)H-hydrate epimerase
MRVLTAAEMRAVDRRAIDEVGVPGMVLMENAAIGVVDALAERFPSARRVAILCGPGNNGGDGLAIARHLAVRGYDVEILLAVPAASLAGDAAAQLTICQRLGLPLGELAAAPDARAATLAGLAEVDVIVDALFGTGLSRPLTGAHAELVVALGRLGRPVLAVDIPSGLDGSLATIPGPYLAADLTVTFAAPKVAHILAPACHACGELVVADLGVPAWLVDEAPGDLHLLRAEELAALLPRRPPAGHKGTFGHVLIVAGSPGKAGAAILATRAAVRVGAGLVTVAVPAPLLMTVDGGVVEAMTLALSADADGAVAAAATAAVTAAWASRTVVAAGPGLGTGAGAAAIVAALVSDCPLPLVLDADALNLLAGHLESVRQRAAPTVLTPHPGELARLLGTTTAEVQSDRLAAVRAAARLCGAVVILKGERTLVAADGVAGGVWVNPTGNAAMGTGGAGDVLTGAVAGLLAQGLEALTAAQLAVYVHGLAGDRWLAAHGDRGLAAGDLAEGLPGALWALAEPAEA